MSKVFLSYSNKDIQFVNKLYQRLIKEDIECFFDKISIKWGDNWVIAIERGLKNSDYIVIILSPSYIKSEWSTLELISTFFKDPLARRKKLRPLLLSPCDVPTFIQTIQHIDVSSPELFELNYPVICKELGGQSLLNFDVPVDASKLPNVKPLPHNSRMPYASLENFFIGRISDLWNIHGLLSQKQNRENKRLCILTGMGGLGKTQLAVEYVHRFANQYAGIYWIDSQEGILSSMIVQIQRFAGFQVDSSLPTTDQLLQVWLNLASMGNILIVLDNFPENQSLRLWLPTISSISMLVTTRRQDLNYGKLCLREMSKEEGLELINSGEKTFNNQKKEVFQLVNMLGGLPLCLEIAKHFLIQRPNFQIKDLINEIRSLKPIKALGVLANHYMDDLPTFHDKNIANTFQISIDLLSKTALKIAYWISILCPSPVPIYLLRKFIGTTERKALDNPLELAISELKRLSLIDFDSDHDPVMHHLISEYIKIKYLDIVQLNKIASIVQAEIKKNNNEKNIINNYNLIKKIIPHAAELISNELLYYDLRLNLLHALYNHFLCCKEFNTCKQYYKKIYSILIPKFKNDHPELLDKLKSDMDSNYQLLEQLSKGIESVHNFLLSNINCNSKKIYNPQKKFKFLLNNLIGDSLFELAVNSWSLIEIKEAEKFLRLTLVTAQNNLPKQHPKIAKIQSSLAIVLKSLNKLNEAKYLLLIALSSARKNYNFGDEELDIILLNLVNIQRDLGQIEEAKKLLLLSISESQKYLEPGHQSINNMKSILADIYHDLGRLEEAKVLLYSVLSARKRNNFDQNHPTIFMLQFKLAIVLKDMGQNEEAKKLMLKAISSDDLGMLKTQTQYLKIINQILPQD